MTNSPRSEDSDNRKRRSSSSDTENGNTSGKRRRINHPEFQEQLAVHSRRTYKKLTYPDYTVGWICALPVEMMAAIAMLDERHESLPRREGDDNVYTLGSMSGHNVVIACLRDGVYGTTSATAVGYAMRTTFRNSVLLPLMVGIGGGVPSTNRDIRLGDVVVGVPTPESPAVRQYDFGKTTSDGLPEPKGQLDKPAPILLSAVTKLKAERGLRSVEHAAHIAKAIEMYDLGEYAYPGSEHDTLFEACCNHSLEFETCDSSCFQRVDRPPRINSNPMLHYGTIGSGNQVMKHSRTRDHLAKGLGIICFEMEAAGLMDYLPCLVIRGICDYCDSQKKKNFQGFAALSAAAYAKDLLSMIPVEQSSLQVENSISVSSENQEHRKIIMEALNFEEAESRRATVKKAHLQTCKWFVEQQFFTDWHDMQNPNEHRGLLWIKGKPGTGKSILMKFVLDKEERTRTKEKIIISFFFNARGDSLERSVIGMYRSLIYQLLKHVPELQVLLDDYSSSATFDQDRIGMTENLKNLFRSAVERLKYQRLFCFIDALDECPESQIRDMLRLFEDINAAISNPESIRLQVLLSSRHYPNISIEHGKSIILEDQAGHSGDLVKYINSELKIGRTKAKQTEQIKQAIFEKARGIFLWVFLTIKILRAEHDKGRLQSPMKRLNEIPLELNDLFRDIITRDNERLPELIHCIQWILYARRPLLRAELYYALLIEDESVDPTSYTRADVENEDMDNYILDCSKGLAELTRAKKPTVQFIHESVREFLLQPEAFRELLPGFQGVSEGMSHQRLRDSCINYINKSGFMDLEVPHDLGNSKSTRSMEFCEETSSRWPFCGYATENVLYHADTAEQYHLVQKEFLEGFPWIRWTVLYNSLRDRDSCRLTEKKIVWNLARLNLPHVLLLWLDLVPASKQDLIYVTDVLARLRYFETFQKVLIWQWKRDRSSVEVYAEHAIVWFDLIQDVRAWKAVRSIKLLPKVIELSLYWPAQVCDDLTVLECLYFAAISKRSAALRLFLSHDAQNFHAKKKALLSEILASPHPFRAKQAKNSTEKPNETGYRDEKIPRYPHLTPDVLKCIELLFPEHEEHSYDLDPFEITRMFGIAVVDSMIRKGFLVTRTSESLYSHLHQATEQKHTEVLKLLLEYGIDVDVEFRDSNGLTALHRTRDEVVAKNLLQHGANVDARDNLGRTPLYRLTYQCRHPSEVEKPFKLLLKHGADIDARDNLGRTPLYCAAASYRGFTNLPWISYLLNHHADVNAKDNDGRTPLYHLAYQCYHPSEVETPFKLLLKHGVDVNIQDTQGETILHVAVRCPHLEFAKLLLLEGADLNLTDAQGWSPLHTVVLKFARTLNNSDSMYNRKPIDMNLKHMLDVLYALGANLSVPTRTNENNADWKRFTGILEALHTAGRPNLETVFDTEFLEKWRGRSTILRLTGGFDDPNERTAIEANTTESIRDPEVDPGCDMYAEIT